MPFQLPTSQEVYERSLSNYESRLNQNSPLADKAFLRVLAAVDTGNYTELNRYAAFQIEQTLALTAKGTRLEDIGSNYGVTKTPAVPFQCTGRLRNDSGSPILVEGNTLLIGDSNGLRYVTDQDYTVPASGFIDAGITAQVAGTASTLPDTETLSIANPITGIQTVVSIVTVDQIGIDQESEESYRRRVLNEIRTTGGGGNGVDYRTWAEQTPGVERAFPYSSAPIYPLTTFVDGDCEDPTTAAWTPTNGALLSKVTTSPHGGVRALRVTRNGLNYPGAYQDCIETGKRYRLNGWARSDGNAYPIVLNYWDLPLWLGDLSTSWQAFDVVFEAVDDRLYFVGFTASDPDYVDFDDMIVIRELLPGDRTVYIECDSTIDPDGVPPSSLLDDARQYINYDPVTGKSRPPLGHTNENLEVLPIFRTVVFVEIRGLIVDPGVEAQVKSELDDAVDQYFRSVVPFVDGVDPVITRNDTITDINVSRVVQDILDPYGANASGIGIGIEPDVFLGSYMLSMGELIKLDPGGIIYVP